MKEKRQQLILEIIARENVETQGQLQAALREAGVECTQATLSRDIKELRLVKELNQLGTYRYVAPAGEIADHSDKLRSIFQQCVISIDRAQNIVVLKTLPGLASAACSAIDGMEVPRLVGSLAGDDTAFLAMQDNGSAEEFCKVLREFI